MAEKRSITISPPPASGIDAPLLARELAPLRIRVEPADVRVTPTELRLLYLSDAPTNAAEATIRGIVAAHSPPPMLTPAERAANLAKKAKEETTPEALRVRALGKLCWVGITRLYHAHNARRARDIAEGRDVTGIPELVPFETWEDCVAAWEALIDAEAGVGG